MTDDLKNVIAFLFKRSGKEELALSELYLTLSMELNWFSPKEAKEIMALALQQNVLTKKGDKLKPTFDYKKMVVPVDFHPSIKPSAEKEPVIKEEKIDILETMIKQIVEKTNLDKQSIIEKIEMIGKERNIYPEVAALLICREFELNLEDFYDDIEQHLFIERK